MAVCLAVGVWAPVFDLLVNNEGHLVLWGTDLPPYAGGLWFALGVICAGAVFTCLLVTAVAAIFTVNRPAERGRAMWSGGLLVAAGFGVLSVGSPWFPLERAHYMLAAASVASLGVVTAVPILRRGVVRYAKPLMVAAPFALVCVLAVRIAGDAWVPQLGAGLQSAVNLAVFGAALLAGLRWAPKDSARKALHGALVAALLCGLFWPFWNQPSNKAKAPLTARPHKVPHVILLVVDTLRRDAVSAFGGKVTTPEIDRLAAESVVFKNAYSPAPWTLPSMVSIMTGVHPFVHRTLRAFRLIPPTLPTLAELLAEQGYATQSIGYNPFLGELRGAGTGAQRGFSEARFAPAAQGPHMLVSPWMYETFHRDLSTYFTTEEIGDMASDWIESNRDESFFLWVHFFDPHMPYQPRPNFLSKTPDASPRLTSLHHKDVVGRQRQLAEHTDAVRALYDAEVLGVDASIGGILATLRKNNLFDDSLIILVSDHGEEILERGRIDHGHSLHNELLAVPLLVKPPAGQSPAVVEDTVSTADIFSTVLDVTGTKFNPAMRTTRSLVPYWSAEHARPPARTLVATGIDEGPQEDAALFDGYKYIRRRRDGREELYDLSRDGGETNNLADAHPQLTRRGLDLIEKQRAEAAQLRDRWGLDPNYEKPFDKTGIHILRTLGYLK